MGKGEIARYEQFLLFPQCFQKAYFLGASKGVIVWESVNITSVKHWYTRGHLWVSNQFTSSWVENKVSQKCPCQAEYWTSELRIDSPAFYHYIIVPPSWIGTLAAPIYMEKCCRQPKAVTRNLPVMIIRIFTHWLRLISTNRWLCLHSSIIKPLQNNSPF